MNANTLRAAIAVLAVCGTAPAASAQEPLTDANGMTLYTFDDDVGGTPACYDGCAVKWPPYLAKEGDVMKEDWTLVDRTDGSRQWAYDGKPLYLYAGDKAKGDMTGDGMGGKWHIVSE